MRPNNNPLPALIVGIALAYIAYKSQYLLYTEWALTPILCALFAALLLCRFTALTLFFVIPQLIRYWWIKRPKGRAGTARWSNFKEIRKAKMFRKSKRFFMGGYKGKAVYASLETSGMVLAPAGIGKTSSFVIPALLHNDDSMIVPDLKGTLSCITANHRKKKFNHDIIILNPSNLYADRLGQSSCYNPLQILIDNWNDQKRHCHMMSDIRGVAMQLYPEVDDGGRNFYWRSGTRRMMEFAFSYVVILSDKPTLAYAHALLSDIDHLKDALDEAKNHKALKGDFARLAKDFIHKFEDGDPQHIESFREGALQALNIFSPSGTLADNTARSDFRFKDLKEKKSGRKQKTVYIIADTTRISDYAPWVGLISWCALTEMIRAGRQGRVVFMCDEATNFKINNLPSLLTLAREYNIVLWIILQELEEWAKVYGDKALHTLFSQTAVKLIMGVEGQRTASLVSDMLGEKSIMAMHYNLGSSFFEPINRSIGETGRKLKTADEVIQNKQSFLFVQGMRPMELDIIGYHEIHPWRDQANINPLFGKKYKGKVRLRV